MFISKHIYFVILVISLYKCACGISDKIYCVNDACTEPISRAKTLTRYGSSKPGGLSFIPNQEVVIYSKEIGSVTSLWGAEINGKRGYVPQNLLRETTILNKNLKLVDRQKTEEPQVPKSSKIDVKPDKPLQTFEIIDGTTFYLDAPKTVTFQDNLSSSEELTKASEQNASNDQNIDITNIPKVEGGDNPSVLNEATENTDSNAFTTYSLHLAEEELSDLKAENKTISELTENQEKSTNVDQPVYNSEDLKTETSGSNEEKPSPVEESQENEEKIPENLEVKVPGEAETLEKSSYEAKGTKKLSEEAKTASYKWLAELPAEAKKEESISGEDKTQQKSSSVGNGEEISSAEEESLPNLLVEEKNEKQDTTEENMPSKDETSDQLKNETLIDTNPDTTISSSEDRKLNDDLNNFGMKINSELPTSDNSSINKEDDSFESRQLKSFEEQNLSNQQVNANETHEPAVEASKQITKQTLFMNNQPLNNEQPSLIQSPDPVSTEDKEDSPKVLNDSPPTMLPIFSSMAGSLLNFANPSEPVKETAEQLPETTENKSDINENVNAAVFESDVSQNESKEELETAQQDNKFETSIPIIDNSNNDNNSDSNENDQEASIEVEDKYPSSSQPSSESTSGNLQNYVETTPEQTNNEDTSNILQNQEEVTSEQNLYADDTTVENQMNTINEQQGEDSSNDDSSGIFSIFTNLFDWSAPSEQNNDNSAIDNVNTNNLKCEASDRIVGYLDFYSFNLNSNMMMHLVTTVVIFITFLLFYLSVNKYRIESPLVAKINQLEKDLLITIKENESLTSNGISDTKNDFIDSARLTELSQNLQKVCFEKEELEVQINALREELEKRDGQIENLEKELETSTEVGLELNRLISEMLDPSSNGSEKLKENVEQFQRQLHEQTEVIKNVTSRLNAKEVENVELQLELEETRKKASDEQERVQELVEKVTSIEKEKEAQQNILQNQIRVYQANYNELSVRNEVLNNEIQILKTKLASSEREIEVRIKEIDSLKQSFKDISGMKNDTKKLNSILDGISLKAEHDQIKLDIEKYIHELKQSQSEKSSLETKYQSLLQEVRELQKRYDETDKEKTETELKLEVLNNYFKKREEELQGEVIKYKSIWDAKEGEATSTTERIKLLQEEVENYKTQNETLKQEILSQEIALKSQISALEKKVHENWVTARQAERKLEDARQEAAQLRNRLTFRQRNINEEMVSNGLDQNDTTMSSQPPIYSPASPPMFYDNGRDQVTKSPIPGLPPFLPPPPGAPFVPPPVPNLSGMPMPPPFMPPPPGYPGDHRPPPLGRMSSPPIKSRFSPESAFSPYERGSPSPIYDSEYGGGPYRNYSPYNSEDDRRGYRSPSPLTRTKPRASKNSLASKSVNRSHESLEKSNAKKSNSMV